MVWKGKVLESSYLLSKLSIARICDLVIGGMVHIDPCRAWGGGSASQGEEATSAGWPLMHSIIR